MSDSKTFKMCFLIILFPCFSGSLKIQGTIVHMMNCSFLNSNFDTCNCEMHAAEQQKLNQNWNGNQPCLLCAKVSQCGESEGTSPFHDHEKTVSLDWSSADFVVQACWWCPCCFQVCGRNPQRHVNTWKRQSVPWEKLIFTFSQMAWEKLYESYILNIKSSQCMEIRCEANTEMLLPYQQISLNEGSRVNILNNT